MKLIAILVFGASVFATTSMAQEDCVATEDDARRLQCYDEIFASIQNSDEEEPLEAVLSTGKWSESIDVSALTDDQNVYLSLDSENQISGQFGGAGRGRIWLRCLENTTAVLFSFNDQFMSDVQGYGRVEYRIDDLELASISTSASTNNKTLGLWRGGSSIPFIKRLLGHDQLIIRATPFNESPVTLTFDIRGIDNAVTELRETCSW